MNPPKKLLLYSVYLIIIVIFFLYYLFPSDAVRKYITVNLSLIDPSLNVSVDSIQPTFPPGLRIHTMNLLYRDTSLLNAEKIKIIPNFLSLFQPGATFSFKVNAAGGYIIGKAEIAGDGTERKISINTNLSDVHVEDIPLIKNMADYKLSGKLSGEAIYRKQNAPSDSLSARLDLADCQLSILTLPLDLDSFTFGNIEIDFILQGQQLRITKCFFKGRQFDGRLSGTIVLKDKIGESTLNISGSIIPHTSFLANLKNKFPTAHFFQKRAGEGGFPLLLNGTLNKPGFELK